MPQALAESPNSPRLSAFSRLDDLLAQADDAVTTGRGAHGPLSRPPPRPSWEQVCASHGAWAWLRTRYGLSDIELDLVLLALAPEANLRYGRLYGCLQDDPARGRPLVGLAMDLLAATPEERLAVRSAFGPQAPLTRHRILALVPDPGVAAPPLLAHAMVLDDQIVDVLLEQPGLDWRLASCCRLEIPGPEITRPEVPGQADQAEDALGRETLAGSVYAAPAAPPSWAGPYGGPVRWYAQGPEEADRDGPARELAARDGRPLLTVETRCLPDDAQGAASMLALAFREAFLLGAVLCVDDLEGLDRLGGERLPRERTLEGLLAGHNGDVVITGTRDWQPGGRYVLGVLPVPVAVCDIAERRALWEKELTAHGADTGPADLRDLAARFRLGPRRIADAALTACATARRRAAADAGQWVPPRLTRPTRAELFASARGQSGHALAALAHRVEAVHGWDDLVLPGDVAAQLAELRARLAHHHQVMDAWGFERRVARGSGVGALFSGPPGTGKTMAAEVIACELGLDLFRIDLATVVSKYVGETEKNLERIFAAAADTDAILLFDEADALFGRRAEVRDAQDRFANMEIAYLLQRMERHDGLVVLTTNVRRNLDEAFTRRLQFVVEFPFPGVVERERIWRACFPPRAPRDPALDLGRLARDFRLTGGSIRDAVLHAAFLAAADGVSIGMSHLLMAIGREFQKLDQVMPGRLPDGGEG
ncbi:ATP-binding protein [Streptomyces afghaniensis]|uniref:ATP-binding protein n=1 Tax=Streptomyces afghaniensis TaxID=66865 RepID=UPI0037CF83A5